MGSLLKFPSPADRGQLKAPKDLSQAYRGPLWAVAIVCAVGLVCIALIVGTVAAVGESLLIGGTAFAIGALVGSIFGIRGPHSASPASQWEPRTNLEDVSDWLTKIVIAALLIEFRSIQAAFVLFTKYLADGQILLSSSFVAEILILFSVSGLVTGYGVAFRNLFGRSLLMTPPNTEPVEKETLASMSSWQFLSEGLAGNELDVAAKAFLLSDALLDGPEIISEASEEKSYKAPWCTAFGVVGVGIAWFDGKPSPAVLVMEHHMKEPSAPASKTPVVDSLFQILFGAAGFDHDDVMAVRVSAPEASVKPGDKLSSPNSGTFGTNVKWNAGVGLLCAGHVVPSGSSVSSGNVTVGSAMFANDPTNGGSKIGADVAVVSVAAGVSVSNPLVLAGSVVPSAAVEILVSSGGKRPAAIMARNAWIYFPSQSGTWGRVYSTTAQASAPGDSGAPVVLAGSTSVIGHVVGASPGYTSYIQDVRYQLREVRRSGLFSGLRI